jgi:hypothetical protein
MRLKARDGSVFRAPGGSQSTGSSKRGVGRPPPWTRPSAGMLTTVDLPGGVPTQADGRGCLANVNSFSTVEPSIFTAGRARWGRRWGSDQEQAKPLMITGDVGGLLRAQRERPVNGRMSRGAQSQSPRTAPSIVRPIARDGGSRTGGPLFPLCFHRMAFDDRASAGHVRQLGEGECETARGLQRIVAAHA